MKPNTTLLRLNLTVAAWLLRLAGAVLLVGCETMGDNGNSAHDHSSGQGSCH
jgi:hypothetical protein